MVKVVSTRFADEERSFREVGSIYGWQYLDSQMPDELERAAAAKREKNRIKVATFRRRRKLRQKGGG